ncbi:MAG: NUDIX domain-containing protein [Parachlamydiales bacterium]|jgi:8-oxo-dGTP pyrophosphatase MutT (NUDIX family)
MLLEKSFGIVPLRKKNFEKPADEPVLEGQDLKRLAESCGADRKTIGTLVFQKEKQLWEVFLVQKAQGHIGFPKGHPLKGERPEITAERELFEETGLKVENYLSPDPLVENYTFQRDGKKVLKTVGYYLAEVQGKVVLDSSEIVDGFWVPVEEMSVKISFEQGKELAAKALSFLQNI